MQRNFQSIQQQYGEVDVADILITLYCDGVKTKGWYIKVF